jgi:uncharacterized SAM-binding protein YcdF (DUF218 family)
LTGKRPPSRAQAGNRTRQIHRKVRSGTRRGRFFGWKSRLALGCFAIFLVLMVWAAIARKLAPTSNTSLTRFDAIIVLGAPATSDGNPSPLQLARMTEGVQEYERGVAPRIIVTGAADRDRPVEAEVMAHVAQAQGIPESAIYKEVQAMNTIENGCYVARLMKSHGWHSAEVVSSARHLPRTAMILSRLSLEWRTHAAPDLEPESAYHAMRSNMMELLKTVRYLVWARQINRCEP